MKTDFQLPPEEQLNGDNFENWIVKINNALKARKLLKYVNKNILKKYKNIKDLENLPDNKRKEILKRRKRVKAKDALASDIIFNNVNKDVFDFIKRDENAYFRMKKLIKLYKRQDAFSIQNWMKKLNSIKAENLHECSNKLNQIIEIFKLLESHNHVLSNQEKLSIMYNSLPDDLQNLIMPSVDQNANEFYNEINKKLTFKLYLKNQNNQNNQNQNIYQNPVYSIETKHNKIHKHNNSDNENSKNEKFCYICNRNGHTTKKCNLNPKNPLSYYHKFYVEYLQKYKSQKKNKNKNKEINLAVNNNNNQENDNE